MNSLSLRLLGIAFLVIGLIGAVAYMYRQPVIVTETGGDTASTAPDVSTAAEQMPEFALLVDVPTIPLVPLNDEKDNIVDLGAYRGKVVLMNLWATWCPPCIAEMPDLHALHQQYQDRGFVVVPIASGTQGREDPAEFLRNRQMTAFKTLYDPHSQFLRIFDIDTLPTSFIIDRTGKMRGGVLGMANWQSDEAKALIEAFLAED